MTRLSRRIDFQRVNSWSRRIVLALLVVATIIVVYATIYQWGMATFEGRDVPFYQALQKVVESLTTAGYGGHAPWTTPQMNLFVLLMNLTGVLLVFLAIPAFAIPMMREVLATRAPRRSDLTDHVIICGHSPNEEVLSRELETLDVPYLYVDADPEFVNELVEEGIDAIVGDPEQVSTLRAANVSEAEALVTDLGDETNPTVILSARRVNPDLQIASVARDYESEPYQRYAGADEIVLARQILGESLGRRAAASHAEKFQEAIEVDTDLRITELLVEQDSDLVGKTFREADVFDRMGVTVVGAWLGGKFVVGPDPDTVIQEHTVLLVASERVDFEEVRARRIPRRESDASKVIVCGYGTVGTSTVQALADEGVETVVIDREPKRGVDVVGDITDPETLLEAGIDDASAVVLSLDEDAPTIYGSLVARELAPDVEVIARADDADSVWKLYNAGADFVLPLSSVTGEILASHLIEDARILTPQTDFEFVRIDPDGLAGRSLAELDLRAETGCTVVAVERNGGLLTDVGGAFTVEASDTLIVAGSEEARRELDRFLEQVSGRGR